MSKERMDVDGGAFKEIKKIKLGGFSFDLRFVNEDEELLTESIAQINYRTENISAITTRKTKGESILHECLHDIFRQINQGKDESFNGRMSYAFYAFIRDNPELMIQILREGQEEEIDEILRKVAAPDH